MSDQGLYRFAKNADSGIQPTHLTHLMLLALSSNLGSNSTWMSWDHSICSKSVLLSTVEFPDTLVHGSTHALQRWKYVKAD